MQLSCVLVISYLKFLKFVIAMILSKLFVLTEFFFIQLESVNSICMQPNFLLFTCYSRLMITEAITQDWLLELYYSHQVPVLGLSQNLLGKFQAECLALSLPGWLERERERNPLPLSLEWNAGCGQRRFMELLMWL